MLNNAFQMGQVGKLSTQVTVMQKLITESETISVLLFFIQCLFVNLSNFCFYIYYLLQILKLALRRKQVLKVHLVRTTELPNTLHFLLCVWCTMCQFPRLLKYMKQLFSAPSMVVSELRRKLTLGKIMFQQF